MRALASETYRRGGERMRHVMDEMGKIRGYKYSRACSVDRFVGDAAESCGSAGSGSPLSGHASPSHAAQSPSPLSSPQAALRPAQHAPPSPHP